MNDRTETALDEVEGTSKLPANSGLSEERLNEIERTMADGWAVGNFAAAELLAEVRRLQAGTVEYAVRCADGSIDFEADHDKTSLDGACDEAVYLDSPTVNRPLPKFCGPHRVVRRSVGPWVEVEDTELHVNGDTR